MLRMPKGLPIQGLIEIEQQERKRSIKKIAKAVTQSLQLNVDSPDLVLSPHLDQPIRLNNQEALEKWVDEILESHQLPANSQSVEPLCRKLIQRLEDLL